MPSFPYPVQGIVYDVDSTTALANVRVTAKNERSNATLAVNTISNGEYLFDAANFTGGYVDGDTITVTVLYLNYQDQEEHVINVSAGGVTDLNLTLIEVPASDSLRYFTVQDFYDFHNIVSGREDTPPVASVVRVGTLVEKEIDNMCSTRFSDGQIEIEVDDCDATTGWSGSTDAVAIAVSTDDADYRTKTGALDLGKSGTTEAFFSYTKSTLTARNFENKYFAMWVYMSAVSTLRAVDNGSAIRLRYGSSSANYYQKTFYKDELTTGWNLLFFKAGDREVTETGSVNDADMTYFEIRFDNTATSDTVTAGTFIMDNIFLVHKDHFIEEYLDTKNGFQWDYYLAKTPVDRMIRFQVNRALEGNTPSWDELRDEDDEITIDERTGRVRIVDLTATDSTVINVFPEPGARQVRAAYIYGKTEVPEDIKELAILMTSKKLMRATLSKAVFGGRYEFRPDDFSGWDKDIEMILIRYRQLDMFMV